MAGEIPDYNLFMICKKPNTAAFRALPADCSFDYCRRDELSIWKAFPFDDEKTALANQEYMTRYFHDVYGDKEDLFFSQCLFVRDGAGRPVATCFLWKAYGRINTLHWLKVKKEWEGRGVGRALLSKLLAETADFPLYLHTQPSSYRAIKLYTDFGFALVTDRKVGFRENHLQECLPVLQKYMPKAAFQALRFTKAPPEFLEAAASSAVSEF